MEIVKQWDDEEEVEVVDCDAPLEEKCEKCPVLVKCFNERLKFFSQIPHWLIDQYLPDLTGTETKIFLYLNRRANFDPNGNHFGRCYASYEDIAKNTGVSLTNLNKHLRTLEEQKLIERSKPIRFKKKSGGWGSSTTITVTWRKRMKTLSSKVEK
jgi:hypothetical protein